MDEFGEKCDFDVDDAVQKLEKLGIVARFPSLVSDVLICAWPDTIGRYYCISLKCVNEIIDTTTEEMVLKAKQGATIA
ncbi:hypothetical protein IFM89_013831 [Coptis chinensis]|uniref:Uncharacterized protein n=1 Tax=Coptis chinensis TaxID=261450 RepID=A0A835LRM0_9MAGN|nr:hypothetical protein IFM89_013831 [Coptis chinensis]